MSGFDPGEGWREVPVEQAPYRGYLYLNEGTGSERWWVREAPVPPLPTEPWTVIRVTWKTPSPNPDPILVLDGDVWRDENGRVSTSGLLHYISGFEVLAEPVKTDLAEFTSDPLGVVRRQTAKTILDRVRQVRGIPWGLLDLLDEVAREFGVSS